MTPKVYDTTGGYRVMVRDAREADQNFVTSTWATNLCEARSECEGRHRRSGRSVSCDVTRALVDDVSEHKRTKVVIACDPANSDDIMGWMAYVPMTNLRLVHFAYVRKQHRGRGVTRAMLEHAGLPQHAPLAFTMRGTIAADLVTKFPSAIYQPIKEFLAP